MELIPAIDIRGGRCVRLYQGDFSRETVFADDPAQVAERFQELGATRLHVVDLDGAREGHPVNTETFRRILASVSVPVQVGGGLRRLADVDALLAIGVESVVLGTAAIKDQGFLREALSSFGRRIIVGIDAKEGMVAIEGWREVLQVPALELAREMAKIGTESIIYTDIMRDGTLDEPNFAAIGAMIAAVPAQLIASGGVARLEHLLRLAHLGTAGAIVGRALYTGALDLREALAVLKS